MRVIHILIMLVATLVVVFFAGGVARLFGVPDIPPDYKLRGAAITLILVGAFLSAVLSLSWYVCSLLRIQPMSLSIPPCDRCGRKPPSYKFIERNWPRHVLVCSHCSSKLEVWFCLRIPETSVPSDISCFRLRWPQFLGLWRRVSPPANK
jgi:hypothetical protein